MKIRVLTPDPEPLNNFFHDVEVEISDFHRAIIFDLKKLGQVANTKEQVGLDVHMLHHLLELTDHFHTYTKTPVKDKRNNTNG